MIISPKYDYAMKELFCNQTVLKYFISDMLDIPPEEIRALQLMNPFLRKRSKKQKQGILDVMVELNNSTKINIELQVKIVEGWDRRQLFYLAKLYTQDLSSGEDYLRLKRCVGISILDFNLTEREEYHTVYRLRDRDGNEFSDALEVHTLELRKKLSGQKAVNEWIRFFNAETEEDLNMIKTKNIGILEAIHELRRMSMRNPLKMMYEAHLKQVRDERAIRNYEEKQKRIREEQARQEEEQIRALREASRQEEEQVRTLREASRQEEAQVRALREASRQEEAQVRALREASRQEEAHLRAMEDRSRQAEERLRTMLEECARLEEKIRGEEENLRPR